MVVAALAATGLLASMMEESAVQTVNEAYSPGRDFSLDRFGLPPVGLQATHDGARNDRSGSAG
jgi:hypothetical protein